ncbi:hypothetical protein SO802_027381 [Lithocarpus litseifolius]|uniref:Programmed cell death protein 2 C-terminal domain-containing protein n=1 Tax=Lithocarpus litseifolius TaxID=425828 RepID=A0AAW2C441_9ROSI
MPMISSSNSAISPYKNKWRAMHWCSGHKIDCQRMRVSSQSSDCPNKNRTTSANLHKRSVNKTLWPEYEMIIENEIEPSTEMSEDKACTSSLVSKEKVDDTMNSLMDSFEGDDDRKSWASFQERLGKAPEQVLRYCRNGGAKPLWPMSSGQPSNADIPKCNYCGGPLCFEFQILPQLLYYFSVNNEVDSLDWATIVALSLKKVILESDAQVVVKSLTEESIAPSSIIMVIEGAKLSLRGFDSWEVNHICRNENSAAHIMAQNARFVSDITVWVEDTPLVIEKQILHDVSLLNDFIT